MGLFQIFVLSAFIAVALSMPQYGDDDDDEGHHEEKGPAKYHFAYSVKDLKTKDIKQQEEKRDGYKVVGQYSLHEPDGSIRTVKYNSDKKTGFNALVLRTKGKHPAPQKKKKTIKIIKKVVPIKKISYSDDDEGEEDDGGYGDEGDDDESDGGDDKITGYSQQSFKLN